MSNSKSSNLVPFPGSPSADEHASAETDRKTRQFAWADSVLQQLGLFEKITQANSLDELRKIVFDADAVEVMQAIQDKLHPTSGPKDPDFVNLKEGALKRLLRHRFDNKWKKDRENELKKPRGGKGAAGASRPFYDWINDLKLDKKGAVRPVLANLVLFLCHHPKWQGVLGYDEFSVRVVIRKRPPWGNEAPDTPWTDKRDALTRIWFQREDIFAAQGDVGRAVQTAARDNTFHPVHDYFNALQWDGTPRLDAWLITYLHADDTPYIRAVGPRFLISGVARIDQPGVQVDHMPVFEGPQGKLKSTALRKLAIRDEWFTDRLSHVGTKDAALETAGVLLIEIAEMDTLTRASPSASKAFLTRRHDRFRPPYGKHLVNVPRQCVFAGSINPPLVGGYLRDETGARRFWPVACHGMIDLAGIERDRDQLWAEAVARYRAGAKWWLETPELEALATAEQAKRFKADEWEEPVKEWLG